MSADSICEEANADATSKYTPLIYFMRLFYSIGGLIDTFNGHCVESKLTLFSTLDHTIVDHYSKMRC